MRKIRKLSVLFAIPILLAACGGMGGQSGKAENYPDPSETLQWTIAFGPGGGNDIMSRTLADILQKKDLYPGNIALTNREGGSGAKGWGYLNSKAGDPYQISTTSGSYLTTPLQAKTAWKPTTFTPIGIFAADYLLLLVPPDGPDTFKEFVAQAKQKKPSIGGIGTVNVDFIVPSLLGDKAGFKFKYVPFDEEGQLSTALLSGSLDAMTSNPGEVIGQVKSGKMKALAFTGPKRIPGLPKVPTLKELGYSMDIAMPRGLILAPDAPKNAQRWWIKTMKKVVKSPQWHKYLKKNYLVEKELYGKDAKKFYHDTSKTFQKILKKQGAI